MSVESDINNALADTASSFVTVKESIQKILERLQLTSPIKNGQLCHHLPEVAIGHCSKAAHSIKDEQCAKNAGLENQLRDLLVPQLQLESNLYDSLNYSRWDNSSSEDGFQLNELIIYGNRLLDECAFSTTSPSFNSAGESTSKEFSDLLSDIDDNNLDNSDNIERGNKTASVNEPTSVSRKKWHCPTRHSFCRLPIACGNPSGLNSRSKKVVIDGHRSINCRSLLRSSQVQRCNKEKYKARNVFTGKGHLKLAAYVNSGLLTIHIQKCRKLKSKLEGFCNSYVKVEIIPHRSSLPSFTTKRVHKRNNPNYDQKFSLELCPDVSDKRVFISVWHHNTIERCSENLGCMSFGISNLIKKTVEGWYYLLTDDFGKIKHFAV